MVKCTKVEEQVPWSLQPVLRWQLDFMCFYAVTDLLQMIDRGPN